MAAKGILTELLAIPLKKLLAIPLGYQEKVTKWLVISNQKTIAKCLVMMWFFHHTDQNTH
jgi:hypothetical protein